MNIKEFLESIKIDVTEYNTTSEETAYSILNEYVLNGFDHKKNSIAWIVDGIEGGNCYSSDHYSVSKQEKPFEMIQKINNKIIDYIFGKDINYFDALDFIKKIWSEEKEYCQQEYYGNYYEYKYITLNVELLEKYFEKQ